jgi:hypothetical protein
VRQRAARQHDLAGVDQVADHELGHRIDGGLDVQRHHRAAGLLGHEEGLTQAGQGRGDHAGVGRATIARDQL